LKLQSLARLFFSDSAQSRFQDNLTEFTNQLTDCPFLKGNLLENVSIAITNTQIPHKLGYIPSGFFITTKNATGDVYQVSSDVNYITLKASSATVVSLWVF